VHWLHEPTSRPSPESVGAVGPRRLNLIEAHFFCSVCSGGGSGLEKWGAGLLLISLEVNLTPFWRKIKENAFGDI
jgi:hypothetical protein